MSAHYPLCENKYSLTVYEEETIDAHEVEKLLENLTNKNESLKKVLKYYAVADYYDGGNFTVNGEKAKRILKEEE